MRKMLKMFVLAVLLAALGGTLELWWQTYVVGKYYSSAGFFLAALGGMTPILLIAGVVFLAIKVVKYKGGLPRSGSAALLLLGVILTTQSGCDRASANVQTLISDDCGVTWKLIKPGEAIPKRLLPCAYRVSIPDYPMQGETKFKTSFMNRVLATVEIAYEYSIVDGIVFIGEAKYLGKTNTAADDSANASKQYESAENAVIDKRIREVATNMLLTEDIVEFSQGEFEDKLLEAVNERLKDKGVRLNFLSFVPTPEEQTRLAIDMMTAMKVYESKGLGDLGKAVAAARAGAPQIQMNVTSPVTKE